MEAPPKPFAVSGCAAKLLNGYGGQHAAAAAKDTRKHTEPQIDGEMKRRRDRERM